MLRTTLFRGLAVGCAGLLLPAGVACDSTTPDNPAPLELTWAKTLDPASLDDSSPDLVWRGSASGDVSGTLTVRMEKGSHTDHGDGTWTIVTTWTVDANSGPDIVADLTGSVDWSTGEVLLNGQVVEGLRTGSAVEHRGQLGQDEEGAYGVASAEGTFRVIP